ncbi:MAG TPA: hypothetical protein VGM08_01365 [Candidatus Saccharimonadales bacterium]
MAPVSAANVPITGGTNGPDCNSGGYFTPSSTTVNSGDTVTISVPANDPYAGGVQVHGFPQGNFVVARGSSVTTSPITANVSYYGTWPSTGCMKGTGTITVNAPVSTPPANSGGSTPPPSGGSSSSQSSSAGAGKVAPAAPATKSPTAPASPAPAAQTSPTDTTAQSTKGGQSQPDTAGKVTIVSDTGSPKSKNVAAIGGGSVVVIAAVAVIGWRFLVRRRLAVSAFVPAPAATPTPAPGPQIIQPQPTQPVDGTGQQHGPNQ